MRKKFQIPLKGSVHPFQDTKVVEPHTVYEWVHQQHPKYDWIEGCHYQDTKDLPVSSLEFILTREIESLINQGELPYLRFRVSVDQDKPIPCVRIVIHDMAGNLIDSKTSGKRSSPYIIDSEKYCQLRLTDQAGYVKDRLSQLTWQYNADTVSMCGFYGHTRFTYQILFSPAYVEDQADILLSGKRIAA